MVIETKIRFEAGGVTITQTFGSGKASSSFNPYAGNPSSLLQAGKAEEEGELGVSYEAHGAAPSAGITAETVAAAKKKDDKGTGEPGPTDTGTGTGGALSGGLTIVFGSLIMDCGTVRHITAKTDSTGNVKKD